VADVKKTAANVAATSKDVAKAFFSIEAGDNRKEVAEKVAYTGVKRVAYAVADYWLMAASAAFIILMDKVLGYGWFGLFMAMWAFDLAVAIAFILIAEYTKKDITLGSDYRRAVDVLHAKSKFVGYLSFASVIVKASLWDGPEHLVMFFKKELKNDAVVVLTLLSLTAVQAAIWTPIYVLGFDSAYELFDYVQKLYF
jgi:hypothetical protein